MLTLLSLGCVEQTASLVQLFQNPVLHMHSYDSFGGAKVVFTVNTLGIIDAGGAYAWH